MSDTLEMLIRHVREIYPTLKEYNENPENSFSRLELHTRSKAGIKSKWTNSISKIQQCFPHIYTENRTIPDEYDPGIEMHFYDENRMLKMVFIKSMVAEIIGVYAIDLKSNPSYDSINSSLQEIFDKHPQLQMYHSRICKILLDHFLTM